MFTSEKSINTVSKPVVASVVVLLLFSLQVGLFDLAYAASGGATEGRRWFSFGRDDKDDSAMKQESAGMESGEYRYDGKNRTYLLYTPLSFKGDKPAALVIALHGANGSAKTSVERTGFNELADREGFMVLYPQGLRRHWNDGRSTTLSKADDVGFLTSLVDHLIKTRNVDGKRVYVTGLSNGGVMTQRLACEVPDRFAAFAPVVANMPLELEAACKSDYPVPIMIINGKSDTLMPWEGGAIKQGRFLGRGGGGAIMSAKKTAEFWADKASCRKNFESTRLADRDPADGTQIERFTYSGCRNGAEVILFGVEGGGHTWPGSKTKPFARVSGEVSRDMNASEVMWRFFERYGGH